MKCINISSFIICYRNILMFKAPSRRSDIEILAYCIVHWLAGSLPWMDVLENKEEVQKRKIK